MIAWLQGKKTYIGIVASFVLAALGIFGVLDPGGELFQLAAFAILTFTGISYRAAIGKAEAQ